MLTLLAASADTDPCSTPIFVVTALYVYTMARFILNFPALADRIKRTVQRKCYNRPLLHARENARVITLRSSGSGGAYVRFPEASNI
jgi:hypothetical protein